jgi:hypothetical protein
VPFVFDATLTGIPEGSNFDLEFFDVSGGAPAVGSVPGNLDEHVTRAFSTAGPCFVRIVRVSGEGTYNFSMRVDNLDVGGNSLGAAHNFGNQFGMRRIVDFLSGTDTEDFYKFTLPDPGTFRASFPPTAPGTNADLRMIQDVDDDLQIDFGDTIAISTNASNAGESIARPVAAGTYYLRVQRVAGSPTYDLTVNMDTAGNTASTARAMGLSGDTADTIEFVGPGDAKDLYRIATGGPIRLGTFLSGIDDVITLKIGLDSNGNGALDSAELLVNRTITTSSDVSFVNLAGTWLVEVAQAGTVGTNYGLVFGSSPPDLAGNTPATAKDLGHLTSPVSGGDFLGTGTNSGMTDPIDFYRFTPGGNGPYVISATIGSLSGGGTMGLELVLDRNLNGLIDSGEIMAARTSAAPNTAPSPIAVTLVNPGTYYLVAFRLSGQVSYSFNFALPTLDTAGNTPATARDLGPLANSLSAGDFVGRIDPEDFFHFRAGGAGTLALTLNATAAPASYEVIRDADNDGTIDPGETLLAVVGSTGANPSTVSLPAGGDYLVHVLANAADTGYSLDLRFTPAPGSTGTFALTPEHSAVAGNDHLTLALQWKVPAGGWRVLRDVELRLRDEDGVALWVKFDEAANTFSLFNPHSGRFGPGKTPGDAGVLSDGYATLHLQTSSVQAAGPTAPSVLITLDVSFHHSAAGRHFVVEAAASDDLGHADPFAFAGTVDVLDPLRDRLTVPDVADAAGRD